MVRLCLAPSAWLPVRGSMHAAEPFVSFAFSVAAPIVTCPKSPGSGSNSSSNAVKDDPRDFVPNLAGVFFTFSAHGSKTIMLEAQAGLTMCAILLWHPETRDSNGRLSHRPILAAGAASGDSGSAKGSSLDRESSKLFSG